MGHGRANAGDSALHGGNHRAATVPGGGARVWRRKPIVAVRPDARPLAPVPLVAHRGPGRGRRAASTRDCSRPASSGPRPSRRCSRSAPAGAPAAASGTPRRHPDQRRGPGILAADACEPAGLAIAALHPAPPHTLRSFLPATAAVSDPVDMIATASPATIGRRFQRCWRIPGLTRCWRCLFP